MSIEPVENRLFSGVEGCSWTEQMWAVKLIILNRVTLLFGLILYLTTEEDFKVKYSKTKKKNRNVYTINSKHTSVHRPSVVVHSIQVVDRYCEFSTNVEHTTRLLYPSNLFRVTFIGNGYFVNKYNISSSMIQDVFFSLSLSHSITSPTIVYGRRWFGTRGPLVLIRPRILCPSFRFKPIRAR